MSKTTRNASSSTALEHPLPMPVPPLSGACQDLRMSVDRFCLLAGIEVLDEMLAADLEAVLRPAPCPRVRAAGPSLGHDDERTGLPGGPG